MKTIRTSFFEMIIDLIIISLIVIIITSCGGQGAEQVNSTAGGTPSINATPTPPPSGPSQEEIEEMAIESILIVKVYSGFEFDSQRNVAIDLQFSSTQNEHDIAIYTDLDQDTQQPINLIERGHITRSNRYRGVLTIATEFTSLYIVRNERLSSLLEIPISQSNTLSYYFEE